MNQRIILSLAIAACVVATTARAQGTKYPTKPMPSPSATQPSGGGSGTSFLVNGSDNCANAAANDAISGFGNFAVDTTAATSGAPLASCGAIGRDVWFYWQATASGCTAFSACTFTTTDTVIAVWNDGSPAGSCPTMQIACNDDNCGLQSTALATVTAGNFYFVEVGQFGGGTGFSGMFSISSGSGCPPPPPPPPPNDDCSTPTALTAGPGTFPFDNTNATTGSQGQSEPLCNQYAVTGIAQDQWYTWSPSMTGTATFTTCGGTTSGMDTKVAVYDGAGCPTAGTALACNDDQGYPPTTTCTSNIRASTITWNTLCGHVYMLQLGRYPGSAASSGTFTIIETGLACSSGTAYCFGDGSGTACPCLNQGATGNGCANSVNSNGANLTASGSASISADTLTLLGSGMPNSSALYFEGTSRVSTVFGDGIRCAGGNVVRLGTKSNVGGASQYPAAGDAAISTHRPDAAGDIRDYQVWYRNADPTFCTPSTFNLSNGFEAVWGP